MDNHLFSSQAAPVDIIYDPAEPRPPVPPKKPLEMDDGTQRGQANSEYSGAGNTEPASPTTSQNTEFYTPPITYTNPHTAQQQPGQYYDPYYYQQLPPKSEYSNYGGSTLPPVVSATPAPAPAPAPVTKAGEKRICGLSMTSFLLLCVVAFLVVSGAILGGLFGSGAINPDPVPKPDITPTAMPYPVTKTSTSPTTSTTTSTSSTIPSSSTSIPTSTFSVFSLPTGTWNLPGELASTNSDCIPTINSTLFSQVWACNATESRQIVIHDLSAGSTDLTYWLDLEGYNIKGVDGLPPTGANPDTDRTLWVFNLPDYTVMSPDVPTGCQVQVTLAFFLGSFKNVYAWSETIYSPKACRLPSGLMSSPSLSCGCVYGPPGALS